MIVHKCEILLNIYIVHTDYVILISCHISLSDCAITDDSSLCIFRCFIMHNKSVVSNSLTGAMVMCCTVLFLLRLPLTPKLTKISAICWTSVL